MNENEMNNGNEIILSAWKVILINNFLKLENILRSRRNALESKNSIWKIIKFGINQFLSSDEIINKVINII